MRVWKDFWTHQIIVFNQHNETLKNENKAYIKPPKHILDHAKVLGMELVGPWAVKKQSPNTDEIEAIKEENSKLRSDLNDLVQLVKNLVDQEDTSTEKSQKQIEPDWTQVENSFAYLSKKQLKPWVEEYKHLILSWPEDLQMRIIDKYKLFYDEDIEFDEG